MASLVRERVAPDKSRVSPELIALSRRIAEEQRDVLDALEAYDRQQEPHHSPLVATPSDKGPASRE